MKKNQKLKNGFMAFKTKNNQKIKKTEENKTCYLLLKNIYLRFRI